MYAQTRSINDPTYVSQQTLKQSRPMRYMTETLRDDRAVRHTHPDSIDASTELRMNPTRLNYVNRDSCEMYGTAPLRMGRVASDVDIESDLRFAEHHKLSDEDKILTERKFPFVDDVHTDAFSNVVDNDLRARSTRVDQRNQSVQNMNSCR